MMSSKKVKIFVIALIFIILGAIMGFIIYLKNSDVSYKIEEINNPKYFKLYINEKYGVIDEKGNILVEAKYDNIDIPNPEKDIFFVYSNYDSQKGKYETQVINQKNERLYTQYEEVLPIELKDSNAEIPYEKSVLMYKENDKYGIINYNGEKLTKAIYDSITSLLYKEGCLLVKENDKYGIININGKEVIEAKYDSITADSYYEEKSKYENAGFIVGERKNDGYRYGYFNNKAKQILATDYNQVNRIVNILDNNAYLIVAKNGKVGVYLNKKQIIAHEYEEIEYDKDSNLFIVKKSGKQGVLNKEGKTILNNEFDYIMPSGDKINAQKDQVQYIYDLNGNKENLKNITAIATEDRKYYITINENRNYGVIDSKNNQILESKYQYIEYAFDDNFIVTENEKTGVISSKREIKVAMEYDIIQKIKDLNVLRAFKYDDNINDFYNSKLEKTLTMEDANVIIEDNYIKILSKNDRNYLDKEGNVVENKNIFLNSKLLAKKQEDKWGFTNRDGELKVDTIYDMVTEFDKHGYAGILLDGKWGIIDDNGNIIKEPCFEIDWDEPEFINEYIKLNFGYGFYYYTNEVTK